MDIKKMTVTELESLAYRELRALQQIQMNLQLLEAEIAIREKKEKTK